MKLFVVPIGPLLLAASLARAAAFRHASGGSNQSQVYGNAGELWGHLRQFVLPHRQRLSLQLQLATFSAAGLAHAPQSLAAHVLAGALPPGMSLATKQEGTPLQLYLGTDCGVLPRQHWVSMQEGSLVAVPVCSAADFERAYELLYTVNCKMLWGNHQCGAAPGRALSCADFQLDGLQRVSFVAGFFLLEKADAKPDEVRLGSGRFENVARADSPPTDKVTKHSYQLLYERYLPSVGAGHAASAHVAHAAVLSGGAPQEQMLEIGLGCNMQYGAGKSARLWRSYFPEMKLSFLEYDAACVQKWAQTLAAQGITVFVGDQTTAAPNQLMAAAAGAKGYELVVDDGAHTNYAIRNSFHYLWPATARGGLYVIEDLGESAFSYLDCEPLHSTTQRQTTTALASVAEMARPLVLRQAGAQLARAECDVEICLLQKQP